jgi:hypothetical protein
MQHAYLRAFTSKVEVDRRIGAAWLEGSFGRGNPDRYSDLDIHLLLTEADLHTFKANVEAWLSSIQPLVLFNLMFDGQMVNALTQDGLRLDVWLHVGDSITLDTSKARILFDPQRRIHSEQVIQQKDPVALAQALQQQTQEFWRCIALLPAVVGRKELVAGFIGLAVETNLLTEILLTGYEIARERGVKNLNEFLPDDTQQVIEAALSMHGLSPVTLAKAHLDLARVLQQHGPTIAAKHTYEYPKDLEDAVLTYVSKELELLGLDVGLDND